MQGILKAKHRVLCEQLRDIKMRQHLTHDELVKLEAELARIYRDYLQRIADIKTVIIEYNQKQHEIKKMIRRVVRKEMHDNDLKE